MQLLKRWLFIVAICALPVSYVTAPAIAAASSTSDSETIPRTLNVASQQGLSSSADLLYLKELGDAKSTVPPDPALGSLKAVTKNGAFTGLGRKVILSTYGSVGQGYSTVSGTLRGMAMKTSKEEVQTSTENAVSYDLHYVSDYQSLADIMQLHASASYSGFSGGFSASLDLFQSAKITSTKAYILVHMRTVTGTESLSTFLLSDGALARLSHSSRTSEFDTTFGDAFLTRIVRGAELYALMEFSSADGEDINKMRAEVSGHGGGFNANATLATEIDNITKNRNVNVLYAQTGGAAGRTTSPVAPYSSSGGVLVLQPDELLARIRDFPGEARNNSGNSAILWAETLDYNAVENKPLNLEFPSNYAVLWSLEDLGKVKIEVDQRKNTADDVLSRPANFQATDVSTAAQVSKFSSFISGQLTRIAMVITGYPSAASSLRDQQLPSIDAYISREAQGHEGAVLAAVYQPDCPVSLAESREVITCLYGSVPYSPVPIVSATSFPWKVVVTRFRVGEFGNANVERDEQWGAGPRSIGSIVPLTNGFLQQQCPGITPYDHVYKLGETTGKDPQSDGHGNWTPGWTLTKWEHQEGNCCGYDHFDFTCVTPK